MPTLDDIMAELLEQRKILAAMSKAAPQAAQPHRFYTVREACELLRIGRSTLYEMLSQGKFRKIKRGAKVLLLAVEVDAMIAKEERAV